ncbi:MAG: superoxide dismutase [Thaumarchaeota archaeon]|nr:superoxide dismutase [Nitrososphaerota archaeon]MCY3976186.1 superoxide dismutase [Nitrososphaerota archaeon]
MSKYELPEITYGYNELEPYIDAKTMEIHHTKHHQKYTDMMNTALEKLPKELQDKNIHEILTNINLIPSTLRSAINFNAGGFDNHNLFWNNMTPNGGGQPNGKLSEEISSTFGSFEEFKTFFSTNTASIQGSGWGWLVYNKESNKVEFKSMPNQTSPRTIGLTPLLGLDVWEHAYYLKYQNRRPEYISQWWNIVNWREVENRFNSI